MSSEPTAPQAPPSVKLISYLYEFWDYVSSTERWPEAYHALNKKDVMSLSRRIYILSGEENYRDPKYIGQPIWDWWRIANTYLASPQTCPLASITVAAQSQPPLLADHPRPPNLVHYVEKQIRNEEEAKRRAATPQVKPAEAPINPPLAKAKKAAAKKTTKKRATSEVGDNSPPTKKSKASASVTDKAGTEATPLNTDVQVPKEGQAVHMSAAHEKKPAVSSLVMQLGGGFRSVNDLPTGDVRNDLLAFQRQQRDHIPKVNEALSKYETILDYCTKERDELLRSQNQFRAYVQHANMTTETHESHFTSIFSRLGKLEDRDNVLARIFAELSAIKQYLKSPNRTEPFDDSLIVNAYDTGLAAMGASLAPANPGPSQGHATVTSHPPQLSHSSTSVMFNNFPNSSGNSQALQQPQTANTPAPSAINTFTNPTGAPPPSIGVSMTHPSAHGSFNNSPPMFDTYTNAPNSNTSLNLTHAGSSIPTTHSYDIHNGMNTLSETSRSEQTLQLPPLPEVDNSPDT